MTPKPMPVRRPLRWKWLTVALPLLGVVVLAVALVGHRKPVRPAPVPSGPLPRLILRQTNSPYVIAISQNGAVIAVGQTTNDTYRSHKRQPILTMLYDAHSGALLQGILANYSVEVIALSPDGRTVAYQTFPGNLILCDVRTWRVRYKINAFANYMAFSPNGKILVTRGPGMQEWDAATGRLLRTLIDPYKPRPAGDDPSDCNIAFSSDGKLLAYASDYCFPLRNTWPSQEKGEQPQLWDVGTGKIIRTLPGRFTAALTFSRDGKSLLCVQTKMHGQENPIILRRLNVRTGRAEWSVAHDDIEWAINSLASSPKSTVLACQNVNHEEILVNEKTGALLQKMQSPGVNPQKDVSWSNHSGLAFSRDGKTLISREAYTVSVWDTSRYL